MRLLTSADIGAYTRLSIEGFDDAACWPTHSPECICLAVRQAARHVTQFYDQLLAPSGLRTTQFSLLAKLRRDGITRIEPAANDRRSKEVHLTKLGEKRFAAACQGWIKAQSRFESAFGSKRASELRALLRAVVESEFTRSEAEQRHDQRHV